MTSYQVQDWTRGLNAAQAGRNRVITDPVPPKKVLSAEGLRKDLAVALIVLIGVLTAVLLLSDCTALHDGWKNIGKLSSEISRIERSNEVLRDEWDSKVRYYVDPVDQDADAENVVQILIPQISSSISP